MTSEHLWDEELLRLDGNLLQSWRWGSFKERQGWAVRRVAGASRDGSWMAQILFKVAGPFTIAYIPCGPTISGDHSAVFPKMMAEIDAACRRARAVTIIMEPNQHFQLPGTFRQHGFVQWMNPFQPRATISIPVTDDESMLAAMHHKTRYHVRLAGRQGIVAEPRPVNRAIDRRFSQTACRNGGAKRSRIAADRLFHRSPCRVWRSGGIALFDL